ncbi:hypothetical protein [Variovorax sp. HJSM1_2]|uniref:hypothetical protein n=1 Tax=Variovorax sp. HJSM1_2 TaxID=3366263 RepID=UPI003BDBD93C
MTLRFLDFDYSEDDAGNGVFDALAAVWPDQVATLHAEVTRVLTWAYEQFPDGHGPLDEGGEWDYDLSGTQESSGIQLLTFDVETQSLSITPGQPGRLRYTLSLSLSGTPAFCAALREQFAMDADF